MTTPGDPVRGTVSMAVAPEQVLRVVTEEAQLWLRRGQRFRNASGAVPGDGQSARLQPSRASIAA